MRVEVEDVAKAFGRKQVLEQITMSVLDGQWLSIIGSSGCGKSTLMNIISGVLDSDRGNVLIDSIVDAASHRAVVGYLLQDFPLYPSLTVHDNLRSAHNRQYSKDGPTVTDIIDELQIDHLLDRIPITLSGGERQRVALGRTLLLHRPVLLLDEPFSNIDMLMKRSIRRYIKHLSSIWGTTTILVTHDQEDAISTSDIVGVVHDGNLVQVGSPRQLFDRPVTVAAADAFGDVQMSWFPARFTYCRISNLSDLTDANSDMIGIRETGFQSSLISVVGYWEAQIVHQEYLGSRTRLFVKYCDCDFTVVIDSRQLPKDQGTIWLLPELGNATLFRDGVVISNTFKY